MDFPEKVSIPLQKVILDLIGRYLLTKEDANLVKKKNLLNLLKFIKSLDIKSYRENNEILERLYFIRFALKCRLNEKTDSKELILAYVKNNCGNKISKETRLHFKKSETLDSNQVNYVDNWIYTQLRSLHINFFKDGIIEALDNFQVGDYLDKEKAIDDIYNKMKEVINFERQIRLEKEYEQVLNFGSNTIESQITSIVKKSKQTTNYLYSGCQWLNEMVGGSFEAGRCYLFLGPPKSFKSGLLLTLALWFRKFNKHIKPNDPKKKPCIIYLTQENSEEETVQRIYNIESKTNNRFKDMDSKVVTKKLLDDYKLGPKYSNIDLIIMYRPPNSITTDDIYSIISDAEDEGYEVVCFIQDHAKKMRPRIGFKRTERHLELSSIIEDFTTIAKIKNLVFIATAHLNRNAMQKIDSRKEAGKSNNVKVLSSSDVGESVAMVENADVSIAVEREFNKDAKTYALGIKLLHSRVASSDIEHFYIPFYKIEDKEHDKVEHTIHLISDFGKEDVATFIYNDSGIAEELLQSVGYRKIYDHSRTTKMDNKLTKSVQRANYKMLKDNEEEIEDLDGD